MQQVKFVDLGRQYEGLRDEVLAAVDSVSRRGAYVMGPEVSKFEEAFAEYCDVKYAVGVGNGSDALLMSLRALGVGPGDEVITAPNSFIASAWVISQTGARIVFCDVDKNMNLDPDKLTGAVTAKTKVIMPVHLTGRVADMDAIQEIADQKGLAIVEDAAQAVGASYNGRRAGSFGALAGFSLHPLKNLHVAGDGGMITTNHTEHYEWLLKYRNHGLLNRNDCEFWGINSRLDTIQAAIGLIKLPRMNAWNQRFRDIANRYTSALEKVVWVPQDHANECPVYHRYMIQTDCRDALQQFLEGRGVESKVNYPIPLHLQPAARSLGYAEGSFPVAEKLARTILSLPAYPELEDWEVDYVIECILTFFSKN